PASPSSSQSTRFAYTSPVTQTREAILADPSPTKEKTMKFRTMCLALMLLLTLVLPFTARGEGAYNDGDMTPTNRVEWWWTCVHELQPEWEEQVSLGTVAIGDDNINFKTQDAATAVAFTFQNTTTRVIQAQGSISIRHLVVDKSGAVLYSETLAR